MSRSGYLEDYDERFPNALDLYRNTVDRALGGKRGQAFLRELVDALEAMPERRLIKGQIESSDGAVCAIGSVGVRRGVDMSNVDSCDPSAVGKVFGIARCMAAEISFENDEGVGYWVDETPEGRWQRMRDWAARQLKV